MTWMTRVGLVGIAMGLVAGSALAQQRPLVTEDPETVGEGVVLIEGGVDYARDQVYPVSGLKGTLLSVPVFGVSLGVGSITELQLDASFHDRLSITDRPTISPAEVGADQARTTALGDMVIGTKIRLAGEAAGRPAFGVRLATKIPTASTSSGLGLGTTDFYVSGLLGKTVQSVRVVGNIGLGLLADPTQGDRHRNALVYGLSIARAMAPGLEVVGEVNGRASLGSVAAPPGTETRGLMRVGARYTKGAGRVDGGVIIGMTSRDPSIGLTVGFTYAFNGFRVP